MQIVCRIHDSPEVYCSRKWHSHLLPPQECPHCGAKESFRSLGYYERYLSGDSSSARRIRIRRFRCFTCRKTISLLPVFAQPYRVVANETIELYMKGDIGGSETTHWGDLIQRYWRRFCSWLPELSLVFQELTGICPPPGRPKQSWETLLRWGGSLGMATLHLTQASHVTPFGKYRCHSPNPPAPRPQIHTPYLFPP